MSGSRVGRTFAGFAAAALLTASGLAVQSAYAAMGSGSVVTESMNAGPYSLTLRIGPLEQMYTQAQVKKSHPKSGEVMLRGTMVMGGMGMGGSMPNHHLELHVYMRSTHAVVTNAMVAITIETPSGKVITRVPIAVMRGVDMGASDIHYGNNVALKDGKYKVAVQVEHTNATFMVTIGHTSMSM
jgi:hypothetical protein